MKNIATPISADFYQDKLRANVQHFYPEAFFYAKAVSSYVKGELEAGGRGIDAIINSSKHDYDVSIKMTSQRTSSTQTGRKNKASIILSRTGVVATEIEVYTDNTVSDGWSWRVLAFDQSLS